MLLYIHIPFCDSKCHYCSFNSYVDKFAYRQSYMLALKKQLILELERFSATPNCIETIFIGGGTPSTVEPSLYKPIFKLLAPYIQKDAEITSEANPNSATFEWIKGMSELGINRLSFGVQSFNDEKLKKLGRAHSAKNAKEAIKSAKKVGINNISLDLIYAVLGDTKELLEFDIETAFSLGINHLSAYALTIEEGTLFQKKPKMSNEQLALTQNLFEQIKSKGFTQYEISNFGSYYSQHNLGYWHYKNYMGVGSGAVGFLNNSRYYPQKDIEMYINNPLHVEIEELSQSDIITEKVFLGLRCVIGFKQDILTSTQRANADILVNEDKLTFKEGSYFNKEYLLSDEIALFVLG